MKKTILILAILILIIGTVSAANLNDKFTAPNGLEKMGTSDFVDKQGHNIMIVEDNDNNRQTWFENDTDYIVGPYEHDNKVYLGADKDDSYILEIVEKDGVKYIIGSWTPKSSTSDARVIWENLQEFNKVNNLNPMEV